jgi:hypothetical protein
MARLVILNGVQEGRVLRLRSGVNRIGRSVDNHLQIPDPSVSSAHCEVIFSDTDVLVRDLNSTNGTFIDGEPTHEGNLRVGQSLQLGNIQMRMEEPIVPEDSTGITVPDLPTPELALSMALPDGSPSCANHPETAGAYRCNVCQQALCGSCVRMIRRISGGFLVFCSLCAGACDPIAPVTTARRRSFMEVVTETLKLPFKKRD